MKTKDINKVCSSLVARANTHKRIARDKNSSKIQSYSNISPNTKSPWVSVEIECYFTKNWDDIYAVVGKAFAEIGLHNFVRIKDDASIDPFDRSNSHYNCGGCGIEVVVSSPETKILKILEQVCCVLNSLGAKTNKSCGLHIHVDHRPVVKRNALASFNNLFYIEDLLFKVSKPHRRNNEFCEPLNNSRRNIDPLSAMTIHGGDFYDERYRSINIQAMESHKTIEIRAFHGTTNFDEIKHFIGLVLGAVNSKTMLSKRINSKNLDSCKSIPLQTRRFIKEKFKKSNSKRKAA